MVQHLTAEEIIQYISDAKKSTPIKVYLNGNFEGITYPESFKVFGSEQSKVIFCEADAEPNTLKLSGYVMPSKLPFKYTFIGVDFLASLIYHISRKF
jgi:hypothetical protein